MDTGNEEGDLNPALQKLKKQIMDQFEKSINKILKSPVIANNTSQTVTKKGGRARGKAAQITDEIYATELQAAKTNSSRSRKSSTSTSVPRKKRKGLTDLTNKILPSHLPMQPNEGEILITITAEQGSAEMLVPIVQPINALYSTTSAIGNFQIVQSIDSFNNGTSAIETFPQNVQYLYVT